MKLDVKVDFHEIQKALDGIRSRVTNPRPMLNQIGQVIVEDIKRSITQTKASPDGTKWQPWSPSTLKARTKKGNAAKGLLWDSGKLVGSINYQIIGSHNTLQIGSNVYYAEYLNDGTEHMPARPFLGISSRAQQDINEVIRLYFGIIV